MASPTAPAEPSWGQVVATTISLWLSRRVRRPGPGRRHGFRWPSWHLSRRAARGLRLGLLVLALAAVAVTVFRFTATSATAARSSLPGRPHQARASQAGTHGASVSATAAAMAQAAAWITGQVGGDEIIACDPAACAALRAHGVAAGRLLPVRPGTTSLSAADVIVASASIRSQFGRRLIDDYAPALLASFGTGASMVDVRASFPGGMAAYHSALRADFTARQSAGAQLLHSRRIMVSPQGASQLKAGEVDPRLLVMLAALASLQPLRVVAFGDASPGVQAPSASLTLRQVTITSADSRGGAAALAPVLAMVQAQRAPYRPVFASIVDSASGQAELLIRFAAPSPLGLLAGGN
jgi:hypothetical protein